MNIDTKIILTMTCLMSGIITMGIFLAIRILFNIEDLLYKIRKDLYKYHSSNRDLLEHEIVDSSFKELNSER